ncbi:MAG: hypothetical protein KBT47_01165 [Armatimonadetes bacterium]|nr:hypothetical protein [Candidatus Hippobium faecium]
MKFLIYDWKYKLVALVLAVMLWYTVQGDANPKSNQKFIVPIEIKNLDADKNAELETMQATVTVTDKKMVIDNLSEGDITAYVDLAEIMEKEKELKKNERGGSSHTYTVPILFDIKSKYTFRVHYEASPLETKVVISDTSSKSMFISLEYESQPPVGYVYSVENMSAKSAMVIGTESEIRKVDRIVGLVSNVSDTGFDGLVSLQALDNTGKEIHTVKLEPNTAECSIVRKPQIIDKPLLVVPSFSGKLSDGKIIKNIDISPSSVIVSGRGDKLINTDTVKTKPIDLSDISESAEFDHIDLDLGSDLNSKTRYVKVSLKIDKAE